MPRPMMRVVEREARVYRRLWHGSVFSSFVIPVLFLAAIGLGLGGLVDERSGSVAGLSYLLGISVEAITSPRSFSGSSTRTPRRNAEESRA